MGAGTPSKKRKLNDSKSPAPGRSLDYFFGKQKQNLPIQPSTEVKGNDEQGGDGSELTDEQLARKLQAEWNQEETPEVKNDVDIYDPDQKPGSVDGEATSSTSPEKHDPSSDRMEGKPSPFSFLPKGKNTLTLQSAGSAEDTISSNIPLDESPLIFDPSKYVSELQRHWAAEGGDASYALLTRCFVLVNSTQSRIKIVDTLVNLLRVIIEGDPKSLLPTVRTKCTTFAMGFQALLYTLPRLKMIFTHIV
jgi:DNA ligase-1